MTIAADVDAQIEVNSTDRDAAITAATNYIVGIAYALTQVTVAAGDYTGIDAIITALAVKMLNHLRNSRHGLGEVVQANPGEFITKQDLELIEKTLRQATIASTVKITYTSPFKDNLNEWYSGEF